jgi:hypothetical protein
MMFVCHGECKICNEQEGHLPVGSKEMGVEDIIEIDIKE